MTAAVKQTAFGMSRQLGVLRRAALGIRLTPLSRAQNPLCLGTIQFALPCLGASFSLDNRQFSTSDAVPLTLELTMTDEQLIGAP